jgi:hypothetical protein
MKKDFPLTGGRRPTTVDSSRRLCSSVEALLLRIFTGPQRGIRRGRDESHEDAGARWEATMDGRSGARTQCRHRNRRRSRALQRVERYASLSSLNLSL